MWEEIFSYQVAVVTSFCGLAGPFWGFWDGAEEGFAAQERRDFFSCKNEAKILRGWGAWEVRFYWGK
jgi:hypothetical protein